MKFIAKYFEKRKFLLGSALAIFIFISASAKMAVDALFASAGIFGGPILEITRGSLSLAIMFLIFLYFFSDFRVKYDIPDDKKFKKYINNLIKYLVACAIAVVAVYFGSAELPKTFAELGKAELIVLIASEVVSLIAMAIGVYVIYFVFKWLMAFRHGKTRGLIKLIIVLLTVLFAAIFIFDSIEYYSETLTTKMSEVFPAAEFGVGVLALALIVSVFVAAKKNSWIASLPRKKKIGTAALSLIALAATIGMVFFLADYGTIEDMPIASLRVFSGAGTILGLGFLLPLAYFARIALSAIASLPTAKIVERRTLELRSLAALNKLVLEANDFENLIEKTAELAPESSGGDGAWIEITGEDGLASIKRAVGADVKDLNSLKKYDEFAKLIEEAEEPVLIQSVNEFFKDKNLKYFCNFIAQSFIIIPLKFNGKRIGALAVLSKYEFGFDPEDVRILSSFADNFELSLENAKLIKDSLEKETYLKELRLAREYQLKLLPRELPKIEGFSIASEAIPAMEVGGDYYDFLTLKNGKHCLIVADVSGKGMSAAFYMAQIKGTAAAFAKVSESPAELLKKINAATYGQVERKVFVTMIAASIEKSNGLINLARAGHMPLLIKNGKSVSSYAPKGIGVGLTPPEIFDANLEEIEIKINPGEFCVMFTDGLNELRNVEGEEFEMKRLVDFLKTGQPESAESLLSNIKKRIFDYSKNVKNYDDITLLVLKKETNSTNNF